MVTGVVECIVKCVNRSTGGGWIRSDDGYLTTVCDDFLLRVANDHPGNLLASMYSISE